MYVCNDSLPLGFVAPAVPGIVLEVGYEGEGSEDILVFCCRKSSYDCKFLLWLGSFVVL